MVTTKDVPIVIAIIALRKIFKHMWVLTQLTGLAKRQNSFDVCVLQLLYYLHQKYFLKIFNKRTWVFFRQTSITDVGFVSMQYR